MLQRLPDKKDTEKNQGMKIGTIQKPDTGSHLVLFGRKDSDFTQWLASEEENNYLRSQLEKDKTQIVINQFKRLVFIQVIEENEKADRATSLETIRKAGSDITRKLNSHDIESVCLVQLGGDRYQVLAMAESMILANYQFLKYFREKDKKKNKLDEIGISSPEVSGNDIRELISVTEAVIKARDLVNEPIVIPDCRPTGPGDKSMGNEAGFGVEILGRKQIESLKMGGLLAVNKGSIDPPTFSILEYKPSDARNAKPYVLVGKGVVFDTGGFSLKPTGDSMDYMKSDMAGAAAVAGAIYAIAKSHCRYMLSVLFLPRITAPTVMPMFPAM